MGEVFAGRYELVDPVGTGGMGSVWRTYDHRDGTFCAAKVLRQSDAATVLRFIREQSLRIRHPHVVAPRNWAGEDDRVLFTMDLVRGGSTATVLHDHGPLPSPYVAVLLEQLLAALDAVHHAGVVHRDVKPSNLLLEPTGTARPFARLTDFGIAVKRNEPRLTSTGMMLGTPGYLAPETFAGADPEPRQDLYSVGLTGVELLTGRKPPNQLGVNDRPGATDPSLPEQAPPGVDPGLWRLLRRLCALDPDQRPASASAAREELLGLPDGRQPSVPLVAPAGVPAAWHPDPEAVQVFDQVGPLPEEWRPRNLGTGPGGPFPSGQPAVPGARGNGPGSPPAPGVQVAAGVSPAAGVPGGGVSGDGRTLPMAGPNAPTSAGTVPLATPAHPARQGRRRPWWPVLLAMVVIGAAVGIGATRIPWPSAGADPGDSGPGGPAVETGPVTGDACSFVEVGARTRNDGGPSLKCEKTTDGDYRWRAG